MIGNITKEEVKIAAKTGNLEKLHIALKDLKFDDKFLYELLNLSARHGKIEVVKLITAKGIDLNFKGKHGWINTAIQL